MSNKWKRIGQDAWVEMPEPTYSLFEDMFSPVTTFQEYHKKWENRTHHPIANLESGWWKEGEVKGSGEYVLNEMCKHDGTCKKERCLTHPCDEKVKVFKPQPTTERKDREWATADNFIKGELEKSALMSDCSQHKKEVAGISDMKLLAEMIGDLHYETLANLLHHLVLKFRKDGIRDIDADKLDLGDILLQSSGDCFSLAKKIQKAWKISKKFMK